jgi:DnaJ-class molecular chaperone
MNPATIILADFDEEEITKKMCQVCTGEGFVVVERGNFYHGETCKFCHGTGRVPMSGEYKKS